MACAQDLGDYYRIPVDARDLNYNKYFIEGKQHISTIQDYTSNNTKILNIEEIKDIWIFCDEMEPVVMPFAFCNLQLGDSEVNY